MKIVCHVLLYAAFIIILSSCGGSGDKDKVGSLSLEVTSTALAGGQYSVSALATYTNPNTTNLVGTEVTFDTSPSGLVVGFPKTISMPTNGKQGTNLIIDQQVDPMNFFIIARVGDLIDSKVVSIPGLGSVTANPTALTFITTDVPPTQKNIAISGGTLPYTVTSSDNSIVSVSVSGSTVTVTRVLIGAANAVITIRDAANASTTVSVQLQ